MQLLKVYTENCSSFFWELDYYPYGAEMPGRSGGTTGYRFGYMGYEGDPEIKGEGNSYTTEFRQYDPRLGRWLSVDPLAGNYPWQSPYVAYDGNPIAKTDPLGGESDWHFEKDKDGNTYLVADKGDTYQTFVDQYAIGDGSKAAYFAYFNQNNVCPDCNESTLPLIDKGQGFGYGDLFKSAKFKEGERFKVGSYGKLKSVGSEHAVDQLAFAYRNSAALGEDYFTLSDYFDGVSEYAGKTATVKGTVSIDGQDIYMEADIQWYDVEGPYGWGTVQNNVEGHWSSKDVNRGNGIEKMQRLISRTNAASGARGNAFESVEWYVKPKDSGAVFNFLNSKDLKNRPQ